MIPTQSLVINYTLAGYQLLVSLPVQQVIDVDKAMIAILDHMDHKREFELIMIYDLHFKFQEL